MSEGSAVAIGACIVLVNVAFLVILMVVSFKHLRKILSTEYVKYEEKVGAEGDELR
jgi:hypothetical protein